MPNYCLKSPKVSRGVGGGGGALCCSSSYLQWYFTLGCYLSDDRGSDGSGSIALVGVVFEHYTTV